MISEPKSSLSKFISYTNGFLLFVILFTINDITLSQGVFTARVAHDGHSNGPYIPETPVKNLLSSSLFSSKQTSPAQLSTIETSQFFQNNRRKASPSYDNLGESIAKKILHSFHLIDDDSEISSKRNNNVRLKKTKPKDNQSQNEAIVVYQNGEDQGTSFILKENIKNEDENSNGGEVGGYILQDNTVNDNGGLTDDEEILSILEQNAKNRRKQKLYIDKDDDSDGNGVPVKAKPGRYVIKKIFKGENGELTAVDWIEDKGHAKQDAYHKEEWEDTQQKRNVVRKKIRKSPKKDEKKDETNDEDEDQSSNKKTKKEKKKRKKKKKKSNKQKNQHEDDKKKEIEEATINGEHIPQLLWSYLSRKKGKDSLPIEQIKISKV